jgi:hypothetical protein
LEGVAKFALKDWSLNGIVTYQSGFPFTVTQAGTCNAGSATHSVRLVPGQDPHIANPDPSHWFNTRRSSSQFYNMALWAETVTA